MTLNEKQFSELRTKAEKNGWKASATDYGEGHIAHDFVKRHGAFTTCVFATQSQKGRYEIYDAYYSELTK